MSAADLPPTLIQLEEPDLETLAGRLSPPERAQLATYEAPKRREDWLRGRIAAKQAIQKALQEAGHPVPSWEELEIRSNPAGAPRAHGLDPALGPWAVSLTHGHGRAAAWARPAGPRGGLPGVDLERVRARRLGSLRFFLHPEERSWVLDLPLAEPSHEPDSSKRAAGPRDLAAIVLWSLKEAAFKAIQPPRGTGLLDVRVELQTEFSAAAGGARVTYLGKAADRASALQVSSLRAGWSRDEDLILAWVEAIGGLLPKD